MALRVLVLCSGTRSVDRAFERKAWQVTSVDWLPKFQPTLCVDILEWDYQSSFPKDHFDFVWASPGLPPFQHSSHHGRAKGHRGRDCAGREVP